MRTQSVAQYNMMIIITKHSISNIILLNILKHFLTANLKFLISSVDKIFIFLFFIFIQFCHGTFISIFNKIIKK